MNNLGETLLKYARLSLKDPVQYSVVECCSCRWCTATEFERKVALAVVIETTKSE